MKLKEEEEEEEEEDEEEEEEENNLKCNFLIELYLFQRYQIIYKLLLSKVHY
jgi:hypothetical protein